MFVGHRRKAVKKATAVHQTVSGAVGHAGVIAQPGGHRHGTIERCE
jgi:hypothetical protein